MKPPLTLAGHMHALLVLGLPLIGSHLAQMAINITDTVMMGWYSVEALAGMVLGSSFFFTLFLVGSGFAWAVMPLVAAACEKGEDTEVRRVTRMGIWASLGFGALVLPLTWFSAPILEALGQEPAIAAIAQDYLRIAGWGMLPALLVMVLKSYLSALERTRVVLWATLAAALLNALADYALIFGAWGAPELGVRGAALASVTMQAVSLALLALYAVRVLPAHALFHRLWRPDWAALGLVARMGVQIGLTTLAEAGLFSASTLIVGMIGTLELAAHGIALQIISVFFMVHVGLANAATVRAGRALGRGDGPGLRRGAFAVVILSAGFSLLVVVAFLAFPEAMLGLFIDPGEARRGEILAIGAGLLAVAALFQFADGAQVIALGLLRGLHDTRAPMIYAAIAYWLIGVPLSYWLAIGLDIGAVGVWWGLVTGLTLAATLMMTRFWRRASAA